VGQKRSESRDRLVGFFQEVQMQIGVVTGGGDVPGLNAAIRAVARRAFEYGYGVLGIRNGWAGLLEGNVEPLNLKSVSGILHVGGTILGTSRTNPLKREGGVEQCLENAKDFGIDALVVIGGDDTLTVAAALFEAGMPVVGIPKTMDNDVADTDYCIGFNSAVTVVAEACERLHTTADSHHRVVVVEVMGRDVGWVATIGGLGGGADFILIPEFSYSVDEICKHIEHRCREQGKGFSIIVVSEGADIYDVEAREDLGRTDEFGHERLDRRNIGRALSRVIEERTGFESRSVVLGHVQRGGSPTIFDRVLATRLGVAAVDLIKERKYGYMVAIQGDRVVPVPLKKVAGKTKGVDPELYKLAKVFY
jgi:phosphofructokinase-like protein